MLRKNYGPLQHGHTNARGASASFLRTGPALTLLLHLLFATAVQPVRSACACNTSEIWEGLRQLYESAGGPSWHRNDQWLNSGSAVCDWYGVRCNNISLNANNLRGTIPVSLAVMTDLHLFAISDNFVTGTLPPEFSAWTQLEGFYINNNSIGGTLPTAYSAWFTLIEFQISNNQLTGTVPPEYATWNATLQHFRVHHNRLTGTLPSSYGAWSVVSVVNINTNNFSGSLPPEYSAWGDHMGTFLASNNRLSGTLPKEYSSWINLKYIDLHDNQVRGTLPVEYRVWNKLTLFDVCFNSMDGQLPPEYANWTAVALLGVCVNRFDGTLPASYASMGLFPTMLLDNNNFFGTVPTSWSGVPLAFLSLHNNPSLYGPVPSSWSAGPLMASLCNTTVCLVSATQWSTTTWICQSIDDRILSRFVDDPLGALGLLTPTAIPTRQCSAVPLTTPPTSHPPIASPTSPTTAAQRSAISLATVSLATSTLLSAALSSSSAVSGPLAGAVQSSLMASRLAARLRTCAAQSVDYSSSNSGELSSSGDDAIGAFMGDNPTRLRIGGRLSLTAGTVIGNFILTVGLSLLAGVLMLVVQRIARTLLQLPRKKQPAFITRSTLLATCSAVQKSVWYERSIDTALVAFSWVEVPTAAAAVTLLVEAKAVSDADSGSLLAVGCFGLVITTVPIVCACVYYVRLLPFGGAVTKKEQHVNRKSQRRGRSEHATVTERVFEHLRWLSSERGPWDTVVAARNKRETRSGSGTTSAATLHHSWRYLIVSLVRAGRYPYSYTWLLDFSSALVLALISGAAASPVVSCTVVQGALWTMFALCCVTTIVECTLRPRPTMMDQIGCGFLTFLGALTALVAALGLDETSFGLSAAQAAFTLIFTVCPVVAQYFVRTHGHATHVSRNRVPSPVMRRDRQTGEARALEDLMAIGSLEVRLSRLVKLACKYRRQRSTDHPADLPPESTGKSQCR